MTKNLLLRVGLARLNRTSGFRTRDNVVPVFEVINNFSKCLGRIYVDGESDKQHCVQHSADAHSSPQEFTIPIGACNMRRQRTLHPRGISFSFTMITSFHPFFVTGMDRAFSIRCFFLESIKGLNAEIDVGYVNSEVLNQL